MNVETKAYDQSATTVGMAQIAVIADGEIARAVLGSCIGLVLYDPQRKLAALGHIVLPRGRGGSTPPGKFADTAIPEMIEQLAGRGVFRGNLIAKLGGGANMFAATGPMQIGESNLAAIQEILDEQNIPIAGQHVGGSKGRRISFDCATGVLTVEMAGEEPVTL